MNHNTKVTWDIYNKDFGKWTKNTTTTSNILESICPPNEKMIEEILERAEDKEFFREIVLWLTNNAPKKLRSALQELYGIKRDIILYAWFCKIVYLMNFRANEKLEQHMILGQTNEWVRKYFTDFPPRSNP